MQKKLSINKNSENNLKKEDILIKLQENIHLNDGTRLNDLIKSNYEIQQAYDINLNSLKAMTTNLDLEDKSKILSEICTNFLTNIVLGTKIKKLKEENKILKEKIAEKDIMPYDLSMSKKKRRRRRNCDIERNFKCVVKNCPRSYGSENSLKQHIRLKHREILERLNNGDYVYNNEVFLEEEDDDGDGDVFYEDEQSRESENQVLNLGLEDNSLC